MTFPGFYVKGGNTYLGWVVHISTSIQQEVSNTLIAIMSCYMEWCEPTLWSHVRVMIILQETTQEWVSDTKVRNKILVLSWSFQNSISLPFLDTYTSKITHIFAFYFSLNKSLVEGWEFEDVTMPLQYLFSGHHALAFQTALLFPLLKKRHLGPARKKSNSMWYLFLYLLLIFFNDYWWQFLSSTVFLYLKMILHHFICNFLCRVDTSWGIK